MERMCKVGPANRLRTCENVSPPLGSTLPTKNRVEMMPGGSVTIPRFISPTAVNLTVNRRYLTEREIERLMEQHASKAVMAIPTIEGARTF
jgi:hypothetical protein